MTLPNDPARRRARLLAELPSAHPVLLGRGKGAVAWITVGEVPVALSVVCRQLPGWARPAGEAAAARAAAALLRAEGVEPLGLLQCHRLGDAEAPGIEGRVQALRAWALAPGLPVCGGTVDVHPERAALLQTHAFALGFGGAPALDDATAEDALPLPEGEALADEALPPQATNLRASEAEAALRELLRHPALADLEPLCGVEPAGRAALVEVPGTDAALAFACADAAAWAPIDPFWAAAHAVAAAARRVACVGAEPLAVMAAFALGPEDARQAWALQQGLAGLRQACLALELPVAVVDAAPCPAEAAQAPLVTPAVAVVGRIEQHAGPVDVDAPEAKGLTAPGHRSCGRGWRAPFEALYLLGEAQDEAGGSLHHHRQGPLPELRLDAELRLQRVLREGIGLGLLRSARDLAEGGLLAAAAEACLASGMGCQLLLAPSGARLDAELFGEAPGRALVGVSGAGEAALATLCDTHRVPLCKVGVAGSRSFNVALNGRPVMEVDWEDLRRLRASALEPWLGS